MSGIIFDNSMHHNVYLLLFRFIFQYYIILTLIRVMEHRPFQPGLAILRKFSVYHYSHGRRALQSF
jgi:hypothetical protein